MSAYIIFYVEKATDEEQIKQYRSKVRATMAGHNVKPCVAYGRMRVVEGAPFGNVPMTGVAMVEFPTYEEAEKWYFSPSYQEVVKHRLAGSQCHTVIVEGV